MDITTHLKRIKQNIGFIENGARNAALFSEVRADTLEMIELIKLFLISERDSYYGYFLMNMQFKVNFRSTGIAGIKLNTFPPVFETNPLLLCKFTLKEIIYIVCHEIDHVVLNHPAEMAKIDPSEGEEAYYLFNLAADAAVNDRIDHEIKTEKHLFMSSPDGVITSAALAKMYHLKGVRPMEHYAYYYSLLQNTQTNTSAQNAAQQMMAAAGGSNGQGEQSESEDEPNAQNDPSAQKTGTASGNTAESGRGEPGNADDTQGAENASSTSPEAENGASNASQSPAESVQSEPGNADDTQGAENASSTSPEAENDASDTDDGEEDDTNGDIITARNCKGHLTDHEWEAGNDAEDAAAAVREFVNAAVNAMDNESRGLMPGAFMSQVEKLNRPPHLSWEAILKKYIGTITANKRKTRARLNRRQPERFDLSGTMDDKILKITVAIDTSGSVDDHLIAMIFNEIFAILAKRKHDITVIECDSRVQRVYKAKTPGDIKLKVKGRGGTMFSPVIEYINNDKYFRDTLLIYFTDGFGEREIPRPRTYRNIWVITEKVKDLSLKEPYGAVLSLKQED